MTEPKAPIQRDSDEVMLVREVRPRWRTILMIGGAAAGFLGGAMGIYATFIKDDAMDKIDPITRIAQRANNGLERVDRVTQSLKGLRAEAVDALCPEVTPECVVEPQATDPDHTKTIKIGPFFVKQTNDPNVRGDGSVFFRWGE